MRITLAITPMIEEGIMKKIRRGMKIIPIIRIGTILDSIFIFIKSQSLLRKFIKLEATTTIKIM